MRPSEGSIRGPIQGEKPKILASLEAAQKRDRPRHQLPRKLMAASSMGRAKRRLEVLEVPQVLEAPRPRPPAKVAARGALSIR